MAYNRQGRYFWSLLEQHSARFSYVTHLSVVMATLNCLSITRIQRDVRTSGYYSHLMAVLTANGTVETK